MRHLRLSRWHACLGLAVALGAAACRQDAPLADPATELVPGVDLPPLADPGGPYSSDGGTVHFDGSRSVDLDGDALSYAWDFGDGATGSGVAPTHDYQIDGSYTVTLVVTDSRGASSLPRSTSASVSNVPQAEMLLAAGDISTCGGDGDEATASLLDANPGTVIALGDNTLHGTAADYANCYDPSWGRHKSQTYTLLGNHEYDPGTADASFDYFGDRAGPRGKGYYSFDLGAWHVIVLNSNGSHVPFSAGSEQDQWLQADLAANSKQCTLAVWHHPRFFSSGEPGYTSSGPIKILWDRLYAAGADVVLNAQMHHYERLAPMTPDGTVDNARGIREFNVGTGGESTAMPTVIAPNSEARGADFGVLKLTLRAGAYQWEFMPVAGASFTDSGSGSCH